MNKYSMYKEAYKQAIYWHINNNPELCKQAGLFNIAAKGLMGAKNNINGMAARVMPRGDALPEGINSTITSYLRDPRVVGAFNNLTGKPFQAQLGNFNAVGSKQEVTQQFLNKFNNPLTKNNAVSYYAPKKALVNKYVTPNTSMSSNYNMVTGKMDNMARTMDRSGLGIDDIVRTVGR